MTCVQRALLYVRREKKKTICFVLTICVLTTLLQASFFFFMINQNTSKALRQEITTSFRIEGSKDVPITNTTIDKVMQCGNIRSYNGMNASHLYSKSNPPIAGHYAGSGKDEEYCMRYISSHNSELSQSFQNGDLSLIEGRHIKADDKWCALISRDLAEQNNLSINDMIEAFYTPEQCTMMQLDTKDTFRFTVIGIYEIVVESAPTVQPAETEMKENAIYIDNHAGHIIKQDSESYQYGVTFFMDDPSMLEPTLALLSSQLQNSSDYVITKNDKQYKESVAPLEKTAALMKALMIILSASSIAVLSITLLLWIRQRTKEIGIYLSMGIKKSNILGQLIFEALVTDVIAFIICVPMTKMVAYAINSTLGTTMELMPANFFTILAVMILVTILSTILASISVLRVRAREILTQLI